MAKNKPKDAIYKNQKWLYNEYIIKNKNQINIAQEQDVSQHCISRWLRKFKIEKIKTIKNYMNKEWLEKEYKNKPAPQIAKEQKTSTTTIMYWIKKFKVQKRKYGFNMGKEHHQWNGGITNRHGYRHVLNPNHPRSRGNYVLEHILVAEKMLGRPLKYFGSWNDNTEVVHHIDGNRSNNSENNLFICKNHKEHGKIEKSKHLLAIELFNEKFLKGNYIFDKKEKKYKKK